MMRGWAVVVAASWVGGCEGTAVSRFIKIKDQDFVDSATGEAVVLWGPNVIVKGPPWLPSTDGDAMCRDYYTTDGTGCGADGTCTTCTTFNEHDIAHIKTMGWNSIRLGVVWAGAQPRDEDALDSAFLARFHAILNLTDAAGLGVQGL